MALIIKTPNQILTDMLRTLRAGLMELGVSDPQVDEGSDYYIMFTAIANELAVAEQNISLQADALMPDTAVGTDLDRILANYGMTRRAASVANGIIDFSTTLATLVPTGSQLVSTLGASYVVLVGGTYDDGEEITVQSLSTGSAANLEIDEVLTWVSTPAFAKPTVAVSQAVTGAVNAEDDDTARRRLLSRMQNPPALGNWQQVADMCESFDPAVQKAFIFPAANGPSTVHIALVGYATETSASREIASSKINSLTESILGQLPEYVDGYVSATKDVSHDVSFKLAIPYPLGAINLGTGGGWLDFQPFPLPDSDGYSKVTVTNSTTFDLTVTAATPAPTAGVTRISWIDRDNSFTVKTATIFSATYSAAPSPHYSVVIDTPFVGIATGDWVFPAVANSQTYVDAVVAHFAIMGPGEKCNIATLLPRAYRKPRPNLSFPNCVDATMLRAVINSAEEVLSADYWFRTYDGDAPDLPTVIEALPNIYIPRHIGFYPTSIV